MSPASLQGRVHAQAASRSSSRTASPRSAQHRQDDLLEHRLPRARDRIVRVGGIAELRRQADGEVDRLHAGRSSRAGTAAPPRSLSASSSSLRRRSPTRAASSPPPASRAGAGRCAAPRVKRGSSPTCGFVEPALALVVVEDRVGHRDRLDVRDLHHAVDVLARVLLGEPLRAAAQVACRRVEAELLQRRQHAAAGFADRACARRTGASRCGRPAAVLLIFQNCSYGSFVARHDAVDLGDQVVVRQQLVDRPRASGPSGRSRPIAFGTGVPKRRRVQVRVHVHDGLLRQRSVDDGFEVLHDRSHFRSGGSGSRPTGSASCRTLQSQNIQAVAVDHRLDLLRVEPRQRGAFEHVVELAQAVDRCVARW